MIINNKRRADEDEALRNELVGNDGYPDSIGEMEEEHHDEMQMEDAEEEAGIDSELKTMSDKTNLTNEHIADEEVMMEEERQSNIDERIDRIESNIMKIMRALNIPEEEEEEPSMGLMG